MNVAADRVVGPVFDHLDRLTDGTGLFEHARLDVPRPEHGYCLDDTARGLIVVCREPDPGPRVKRLAAQYLDFTLAALTPEGRCHNRMDVAGRWTDDPALGDWWGRAIWGLGVAVTRAPTNAMRARALLGFRTAARARSPHPRALAFAAIGAGEVLQRWPGEIAARALLRDALSGIGIGIGVGVGGRDPSWPWPEDRLTYGNGAVVEAMLLGGSVLDDASVTAEGLRLLEFLMMIETRGGHFSVTPVGGRDRHDHAVGFDQQPIEVAALADACARAFDVTRDARWRDGVRMAWAWFLGDNDSRTPMFDERTGGGFDGLEADGRNQNQGAESTLAMLSTAQQARRLDVFE